MPDQSLNQTLRDAMRKLYHLVIFTQPTLILWNDPRGGEPCP